MKKLFYIFIIIIASLSTNAIAQNDRTGSKALIFQVQPGLDVNAYEGGIGGKMYFSRDLAGRIGFGLTLGKNNTQINITPGVTYNLLVSKPVTFYTGADLRLKSGSGDASTNKFVFGLGALVGAEWMVDKNVSLSGEYYLLGIQSESPKGGDTQTTIVIGGFAKFILSFYF